MKKDSLKVVRIMLISLFYLTFIVLGIQSSLLGDNYGPKVTTGFLLGLVGVSLVVVDSHIRKRPLIHSHQLIIYLTWPIAIPIYYVWTRKWRGLGFILLHIFLLISVLLFAQFLANYLK